MGFITRFIAKKSLQIRFVGFILFITTIENECKGYSEGSQHGCFKTIKSMCSGGSTYTSYLQPLFEMEVFYEESGIGIVLHLGIGFGGMRLSDRAERGSGTREGGTDPCSGTCTSASSGPGNWAESGFQNLLFLMWSN
jgi:hypothetical protein